MLFNALELESLREAQLDIETGILFGMEKAKGQDGDGREGEGAGHLGGQLLELAVELDKMIQAPTNGLHGNVDGKGWLAPLSQQLLCMLHQQCRLNGLV